MAEDFLQKRAVARDQQIGVRSQKGIIPQFALSMIETLPEWVGIEPSTETQRFRAEHPILGFASQLPPLLVPYVGWELGAAKIPAFGRALSAVQAGTKSKIAGTAFKEIVKFAPLEAGRVATAAAVGDEGATKDIAKESLITLGLFGAFGAGIGALRAGTKPPAEKLPSIPKEVDLNEALTIQLRQLKALKASATEARPEVDFWINRYSRAVREEHAFKDQPHVQALELGSADAIDRLFKVGRSRAIVRRRLVEKDWPKEEVPRLEQVARDIGLAGQEEWIRFPRFVRALKEGGAKEIAGAIADRFVRVGYETFLAREANDGLYLVAKRVKAGGPPIPIPMGRHSNIIPPRPAVGDEWVMFLTDVPEKFVPGAHEWIMTQTRLGAWGSKFEEPIGTEINEALHKSIKLFGLRNYNDIATVGEREWAEKMKAAIGPLAGDAKVAADSALDFIRANIAPSTWQFGKSPLANFIFKVAKSTSEFARSRANALFYGEQKLSREQGILKSILLGVGGSKEFRGLKAVEAAIDDVFRDPKDAFDFWRAQNGAWTDEQITAAVTAGDISPTVAGALDVLNKVDEAIMQELQQTQLAFGETITKAHPRHRMITNTFIGTWRTPVLDAKGRVVALGSGRTRAESIEEAEFIVAQGLMEGRNWRLFEGDRKSFLSDSSQDVDALIRGDVKLLMRGPTDDQQLASAFREKYVRTKTPRPAEFRKRTGMGGYFGEYAPWKDAEELKNIVYSGMLRKHLYMAELNVKSVLADRLKQLADQDPALYREMLSRFDDLFGRQSALSKGQNAVVDKLLAPYFGKDSASRAIALWNGAIYHLSLGFGNLAFPAVNAVQFLQTAVPQVAMLFKAEPQLVAKYYGWGVASGKDGLPKTGVGIVSIAKLIRQAIRELRSPDDQLLEAMSRAAQESVLAPRIREEFVGETSRAFQGLQEVLDAKGIHRAVIQASAFLPTATERFTRSVSFVIGHIIGRDFFKLSPELAYSLARQFTERTMFGYSAADRAAISRGPIGNAFMMFKNWQLHYIGWLLEYMKLARAGEWSPLLYMAAGSSIVGGVRAMPFWFAFDGLSRLTTDKSGLQLIYDTFNIGDPEDRSISDAIYYGLPGFFGLSVQSSAEAAGADPLRDAGMLFNFVQWDRMKALGKAVGSAIDHYQATGEHPVQDRYTRDKFWRALAPKTLYRVVQGSEEGVIRSLSTGHPLAKAGTIEKFLYSLGLTPVEIERQLDVATELWKDREKMRTAVTTMGRAWAAAQQRGDSKEMQSLLVRALASGVPIDSIIRSANAQIAKDEQEVLERSFKLEKLREFQSVIGRR